MRYQLTFGFEPLKHTAPRTCGPVEVHGSLFARKSSPLNVNPTVVVAFRSAGCLRIAAKTRPILSISAGSTFGRFSLLALPGWSRRMVC